MWKWGDKNVGKKVKKPHSKALFINSNTFEFDTWEDEVHTLRDTNYLFRVDYSH